MNPRPRNLLIAGLLCAAAWHYDIVKPSDDYTVLKSRFHEAFFSKAGSAATSARPRIGTDRKPRSTAAIQKKTPVATGRLSTVTTPRQSLGPVPRLRGDDRSLPASYTPRKPVPVSDGTCPAPDWVTR